VRSNKTTPSGGTTKAVIATKVKALHAQGKIKIAKMLGIGASSVQRILA
jgi:hypothetical protein